MLFERFRFCVRGNKVITPGIYWGCDFLEIYSKGDYAIWYHKGIMGWSGRGMTAYYPSVYMLVRKGSDLATVLLDISPGRKWKAVKDCLIEMIESLSDEIVK